MFDALGKLVVAIGIAAALIIYSAFSWGYVTFTFYNWFILPTFTALPIISVIEFVGIQFFITSLIRHSGTSIKKEYQDQGMYWFWMIGGPWVSLFLVWMIKGMFF
jgi:hypothetical protein